MYVGGVGGAGAPPHSAAAGWGGARLHPRAAPHQPAWNSNEVKNSWKKAAASVASTYHCVRAIMEVVT
jgi:hypothetical protein